MFVRFAVKDADSMVPATGKQGLRQQLNRFYNYRGQFTDSKLQSVSACSSHLVEMGILSQELEHFTAPLNYVRILIW